MIFESRLAYRRDRDVRVPAIQGSWYGGQCSRPSIFVIDFCGTAPPIA